MYKAIDIAIIPEQSILNLACQINASFEDRRIDLNLVNAVPHLTLSMGVIAQANEQVLVDGLKVLAEKYQGLELELSHVFNAGFKTDSAEGLGIAASEDLMNLHNDSVELMQAYIEGYYEADIFADYEQGLGESCMNWLKRFQVECTGKNFDPHITLGFGSVPEQKPCKFKAGLLALYQLGNYCTCNSLIAEFNLHKSQN
ncbi:MAG: hypothetical protein OXU45_09520 [Candidatus Melainabacteria bacterium]|nr:hypothetical protein [Candidatus Melainabacteria bacterium]